MSTRTVRTPVTFDAPSRRVEGGYAVYPNALMFEEGSYPDKGFDLSAADMDAAIAGFTPVGGAIEHTPFLRGRALTVRSIRRDDANPKLLRAEVAVPLGLDALLDDAERSLSAEWDRGTKRLVGAALTLNPRIKQSSLIAKFAEEAAGHSDDPAFLRETIAALAAFCACQAETTTTTKEAAMPTVDEKRAMARAKLDEWDEESLDILLAPDDEADGEGQEAQEEQAPAGFASFADSPEAKRLQREVAELKARDRANRDREIERRSAEFARKLVVDDARFPAHAFNLAGQVYALFAAADDQQEDTIHFSVGDQEKRGTRTELLEALMETIKPRGYGSERLAVHAGAASFSMDDGRETPDQQKARIDARLANTSTGRAVLARRNGTGRG